eukprot:scaffold65415_cov42-Attheya_sp.AAC.1
MCRSIPCLLYLPSRTGTWRLLRPCVLVASYFRPGDPERREWKKRARCAIYMPLAYTYASKRGKAQSI